MVMMCSKVGYSGPSRRVGLMTAEENYMMTVGTFCIGY